MCYLFTADALLDQKNANMQSCVIHYVVKFFLLTEFDKKNLSIVKGKSGLCERQWQNLTSEHLKLVFDLKIQMKLGSFGWPMGVVLV